MTPRQRVLAALNHQQPDKVPIDFSAHRSSGISAIAYAKLRRHMKLPERPIRVYDMIQQLAIVDPDVLDRFGVDTVEMGRGFLTDDRDWKDWTLPDGTPCQIPYYVNVRRDGPHWLICSDSGIPLGIQKKGCLYFEQIHFPRMDRPFAEDDFADLESSLGLTQWSTPHPGAHLPLNAEGLAEMARCAKRLRESTDRAIVGLFGGNMFETPQMLYRMDNYLMYMGLYPEATLRLSEALCSNLSGQAGKMARRRGALYRCDPLRRRPGLPERPTAVARNVPAILQTVSQANVEAGQGTGQS